MRMVGVRCASVKKDCRSPVIKETVYKKLVDETRSMTKLTSSSPPPSQYLSHLSLLDGFFHYKGPSGFFTTSVGAPASLFSEGQSPFSFTV